GAEASTNSLGVTVNPTVIDGLNNDRVFDVLATAVVSISGVEMKNGNVVLERSGGAIRNLGNLTINDSDVLSSFADGNGGGIVNGNLNTAATLTLNRTNVKSNSAGSATSGSQFGKGGGVDNENGSVTIADGTFSANSARLDGGAIYNNSNGSVFVSSATLSSNLSGRDGGAVYNNGTAALTMLSTTLANNKAD